MDSKKKQKKREPNGIETPKIDKLRSPTKQEEMNQNILAK